MDLFRRLTGRRQRPYWYDPPGEAPATESAVEPVERTTLGTRAARIVSTLEPRRVGRYVAGAGDALRQSPVFAPFTRLSVGLTYEGGLLKLLVCEGSRVVSWETIPFDPRIATGPTVAEPYNLGRLIRDAFARRGLPRWRVHCALPGFGALSRVIEVPRTTPRDRRRVVLAEAMRALGVSPGRHYVYWQVVDEQGDNQLVFVLAVPRDGMRSLIEAMRAAGIRPRTVDITPLALARGIGQPDAIAVELDPHGIDLVVVLDDIPLVVRSVAFEQAMTLEEAQQAALDLVATELRRYEDVYVGSRVDRSVPIYLAGDLGAGLRVADRFRTTTGHPVGRLAPLLDYPEEFPVGEYLTNIGLILKEA
jgi:Tfp pilus assembly PilM family ATPase